jgi:hypothetical protein
MNKLSAIEDFKAFERELSHLRSNAGRTIVLPAST